MRITYLHQYFSTPAMSGGGRSFELARRLVSRGHSVNMVAAWPLGDGRRKRFNSVEGGINISWLPVPYSNEMSYSERLCAFFGFAIAASWEAARFPTDVIFATSTPLTIAIPAVYASRRRGVPMVFEVRDLWPDVPIEMGILKSPVLKFGARALERFAYRNACHIVALAPSMRDYLSGKGVPLKHISVIPNGADLDLFDCGSREDLSVEYGGSGDPPPEGLKSLLYCGALGPSHDPMYLVKLADELFRQRCRIQIVVVGEGQLRPRLESEADRLGCLNETIRFVGAISRGDVPGFYKRANASVMTFGDYELLYRHSVQNKFFDSLAAGRPVFANYSGWVSELAEQNNAGRILPRDDIPLAAKVLADCMLNDEWLKKASAAARRLAEDFDRDSLACSLERVLAGVICTAAPKGG